MDNLQHNTSIEIIKDDDLANIIEGNMLSESTDNNIPSRMMELNRPDELREENTPQAKSKEKIYKQLNQEGNIYQIKLQSKQGKAHIQNNLQYKTYFNVTIKDDVETMKLCHQYHMNLNAFNEDKCSVLIYIVINRSVKM